MFAAGLQLALCKTQLRKNSVPLRFHAPHLIIREFPHATDGGRSLQDIHRLSGKFENVQLGEDVLRFLQEMRADLGELPLLLGGNDRLGLIESVRDQVVELFPILELEHQQAKLRF